MVAYVVKTGGGRNYVVFQADGPGVDDLYVPGGWYASPSSESGDKPLTGGKSPAVDVQTPFASAAAAEEFVKTLP